MNALREALLRGRNRPRHVGAGSPTTFRSDGYEFVELRGYVDGDDPRRIDWAASARTGTLQTRVVLEDVALTLACIRDTSPSMQAGRARPLTQSASEIETLWFQAALTGDRVYDIANDTLTSSALPRAQPFSLEQSLRTAAAALSRGSALLVISDFYDGPLDDDLLFLLGTIFDCTALVAADPWRDDLALHGLVRVRDSESGITANVYMGRRERQRYLKGSRARANALGRQFQNAGWRTGVFDEDDGRAALFRAFGLA